MASSVGRRRQSGAAPSIKDTTHAISGPARDGLILFTIAVAAGLVLYTITAAREWAVPHLAQTLGLGWALVVLWTASVAIALRHNRRLVFSYWRRWITGAVAVALAVGVLSTIVPSDGPFEDTGLGGLWGLEVGGTPPILAAAKLLAIALLAPALLWPRSIGPAYYRGIRQTYFALRASWRVLWMAGAYVVHQLDRFDGKMRDVARRRKEEAETRSQTQGGAGPPAEDGAGGPESSVWNQSQPGMIPTWDPGEPAAQIAAPENSPAAADSAPSGKKNSSAWQLPPVDLLAPPDTHHAPASALQQMARLVETTLGDHGVRVEVTDIKAGPRIVQFGLVPGWVTRKGGDSKDGGEPGERSRVKVQSILTREKDMALALKTPYLRVEAPVPGEALVGLEVPNPSPSKVHLREVMETPGFSGMASKGGLPIAIGQDTGGGAVALDLAALPHILIAGSTGAGKSVMINSIVASFLLTNAPDQLRILMIDPKRVELTPFNGIPHLICPVIVNADEANGSLRGLIREMMRRYKLMEEMSTRNIDGYNSRSKEKMPYLVLIVDELADLMMVGGFDIEQNLVRLAQLGRATGIHLVLATQRPSVNVVTGLLKANIAARAAFAVASQVDSRVILDAVGAEKLMGKGDMLLLHKESPKPRRVQGALVYDQEIEQIVEFWLNQKGPPVTAISLEEEEEETGSDGPDIDAHMLETARELAARNPDLTPSYLERRLKIGGRKADQIMEVLGEEGFI